MSGKFITGDDVSRENLEWGSLAWFSGPRVSNAEKLVVIEVSLSPGGGHSFHKHPRQEEVIYVLAGEVEQWVGREKRVLRSGDSAFVAADAVHASFNTSGGPARLLAILAPCIGPEGYELVDVADGEPWKTLRSAG